MTEKDNEFTIPEQDNDLNSVKKQEVVVLPKTIDNAISTVISPDDPFIEFNNAMAIADMVENSTFAKNFTDKDGKVVKADIIGALVLGNELGFKPMTSLALGKNLKADKIFAVERGKMLGLSAFESIQQIHTIPGGGGRVTLHTGINALTFAILRASIKFKKIEDYISVYHYKTIKDSKATPIDESKVLDHNGEIKDIFYLVDGSTTPTQAKAAAAKGLIILSRTEYTKRTTFVFNRSGYEPHISSYTLHDAQVAELYRVFDAKGNLIVAGKDNWNKNPKQMLENRAFAIGARIIGGDVILNTYETESEAEQITN